MGQTERARAERALEARAADDLPDDDTIEWPAAGSRIAKARERRGLDNGEVASRLAVTFEGYRDVEEFDDEVFTVIDLNQLSELGAVLAVKPAVLLLGDEAEPIQQDIAPEDVVAHLNEHLATTRQSIEELEEAVGWFVGPVIADPRHLWTYPVEALYVICKAIGVDWVRALPPLPVS